MRKEVNGVISSSLLGSDSVIFKIGRLDLEPSFNASWYIFICCGNLSRLS